MPTQFKTSNKRKMGPLTLIFQSQISSKFKSLLLFRSFWPAQIPFNPFQFPPLLISSIKKYIKKPIFFSVLKDKRNNNIAKKKNISSKHNFLKIRSTEKYNRMFENKKSKQAQTFTPIKKHNPKNKLPNKKRKGKPKYGEIRQ